MGLLLAAVVFLGLGVVTSWAVLWGGGGLASSLMTAVYIPVYLATDWAALVAFRRYGNASVALPELSTLASLRDVYLRNQLQDAPNVHIPDNPYFSATDADLLDVCFKLNPQFPRERVEALFATVKGRVEANYLADGRRISLSLRSLRPALAPVGSTCAKHVDTPAQVICLRCGTFACTAHCASLDGKHCNPCLAILIPHPL